MAIEATENPTSTQEELAAMSQRIDNLRELIAGAEEKYKMWGHEPIPLTTRLDRQHELELRTQGMKDALDLITGKTNLNSPSLRELKPKPAI